MLNLPFINEITRVDVEAHAAASQHDEIIKTTGKILKIWANEGMKHLPGAFAV
jgi:hypothetical protein